MNEDQGKERWGKWSNRKRKSFKERDRGYNWEKGMTFEHDFGLKSNNYIGSDRTNYRYDF